MADREQRHDRIASWALAALLIAAVASAGCSRAAQQSAQTQPTQTQPTQTQPTRPEPSAAAAPTAVNAAQPAATNSEVDAKDLVALTVARGFMTGLLTADSDAWRPHAALPMAWGDRCTLLQTWAAVSEKVNAQRPPPGAVRIVAVLWAAFAPPDAVGAAADAWRALSDIRTSCGGPRLDKIMAQLHGHDHLLVRIDLATPEGKRPVLLRLTRGAKGWRVTGMMS